MHFYTGSGGFYFVVFAHFQEFFDLDYFDLFVFGYSMLWKGFGFDGIDLSAFGYSMLWKDFNFDKNC